MKKICFITAIFLFLFSSSLKAQTIECEVIEASPSYSCKIKELSSIRWILIHHFCKSDRKRLSELLKKNNGKQVTFIFRKKRISGILFRLSNCFGRGLLIYRGKIEIHKHEKIKLIFP